MSHWQRLTGHLAIGALLVSSSGCFCLAQKGYRVPTLIPRSIAYERAESKVHDPFPITEVGPDISGRPPGFISPRPLPRKVEEQSGIAALRNQLGAPAPPAIPGISNRTYPGAIR